MKLSAATNLNIKLTGEAYPVLPANRLAQLNSCDKNAVMLFAVNP